MRVKDLILILQDIDQEKDIKFICLQFEKWLFLDSKDKTISDWETGEINHTQLIELIRRFYTHKPPKLEITRSKVICGHCDKPLDGKFFIPAETDEKGDGPVSLCLECHGKALLSEECSVCSTKFKYFPTSALISGPKKCQRCK